MEEVETMKKWKQLVVPGIFLRISIIMVLKSDSHLPKKIVLFVSMKVFKNGEKGLLFHLKSCFCSQTI